MILASLLLAAAITAPPGFHDGKLYVAIGSSCTDCRETNPEHATILQLDADGGRRWR